MRCPASCGNSNSVSILRASLRQLLATFIDLDRLDDRLGCRAGQVYTQKTVFHDCGPHFDPVGQHKAALELTRGNATVQEKPLIHFGALPAPNHQLAILDRHAQIVLAKACNSQRDTRSEEHTSE